MCWFCTRFSEKGQKFLKTGKTGQNGLFWPISAHFGHFWLNEVVKNFCELLEERSKWSWCVLVLHPLLTEVFKKFCEVHVSRFCSLWSHFVLAKKGLQFCRVFVCVDYTLVQVCVTCSSLS